MSEEEANPDPHADLKARLKDLSGAMLEASRRSPEEDQEALRQLFAKTRKDTTEE